MHREESHMKTRRDWRYVAISQGVSGVIQAGRGKGGVSLRAFRERVDLPTP